MKDEVQLSPNFVEDILDSGFEGVFAFDLHFNLIYWNAEMEEIFGLKKERLLGKDIFSVFPFLKDIGEDVLLRKVLQGHNFSSENRPFTVPESGKSGYFQGWYSPLKDKSDKIHGGVGVIRDVTVRKESEDRLRKTEARFQVMANYAPVALWMARQDSMCDFFNEGWLKFTGRSMEKEFGLGWTEGIHFEDFQRYIDTYLEAFSARKSFTMEYRLKRYDGEYRWILDNGVPRFNPDGTFVGYIGSCIDITDQKNAQAELSLSVEKLREALQVRDDFLSIASHELNTPITSLKMQIQMTKRNMNKTMNMMNNGNSLKRAIERLDIQITKLSGLVGNLLDVSRIRSGKMKFNFIEMDLSELVHEIKDHFQLQIDNAGCRLELDIPPKCIGQWDRIRMEQVIVNLLSNAIKFGEGNPIQIKILKQDSKVIFSVTDQGIGISTEDQKRIFNRFERAAKIENFGGFGLGLFITKEIVDGMGGKISVQSEPKKGATFIVELPLVQANREVDTDL